MTETVDTPQTMDDVFNEAVEKARVAWSARPWELPMTYITQALKDRVEAFATAEGAKEKIEAAVADFIIQGEMIDKEVQRHINESYYRDSLLKEAVQGAITKNQDLVEEIFRKALEERGSEIVIAHFKKILDGASTQLVNQMMGQLFGTMAMKVQGAIASTQHVPRSF